MQAEVKAKPVAVCQCGCNVEYQPTRKDQRYIGGHRFAAYRKATHVCPACGSVHQMRRQTNA